MKTLGELLRNARQDKGLTLDQISTKTKIEVKYLKALEGDQYHLLPPPTFTKGFIRNYAKVLGKSPDELVAVYRRDFQTPVAKTDISKAPPSASLTKPLLGAIPKNTLILSVIGAIVFFSYLAFQYRAIIVPPPLSITQPQENAVVTSPVTIEGKTSPDSIVTINQDTDLSPNQSGVFITQLTLSPGEHKLEITATNRFGRVITKNLMVTVLSQ